jgi:phytoene synthase
MSTLAADHAACAAVLARSGSSFALPIRLLPAAKRRGTTALYAFCRRADDIVDDAPDPGRARSVLDAFEGDLGVALAGGHSGDPVIRAVVDTVRRYAIPAGHLHAVVAGVRMDLDRSTYGTFAELEEYCRRVAGAVGLASLHVWGFRREPGVEAAAHACGLAFQLTNILRDIPEDTGRGRCYLALEDLATCGCDLDELRAGHIGPQWDELAAVYARRAAACFRAAEGLDRALSTDGRIIFRAMFGGYRELFLAVCRSGARIFHARVRPSRTRLVASMLSTVALGPRPFLKESLS